MKNKNRKSKPRTKKLWRQLVSVFGKNLLVHRRKLVIAYIFNFMAVGAALLIPWPLKMIIDNVISGEAFPEWMRIYSTPFSQEVLLALLTVAVILFAGLNALTEGFYKLTIARVRERLSLQLRGRLLSHVQKLPPNIYTDHRTGELVHRLVNDVNLFTRLQTKTLPLVFKHVTTATLILASMFWLAPRLAIISCIVIPAMVLIMHHYGPRLSATAKQKRKYEGEVSGLAQEIVRGLPTIQALGGEGYTNKRFYEKTGKSLRAGISNVRVGIRMEQVMKTAQGIALALITGGGALFVLQGHLTIGVLTVFVTYIKRLLSPIEKINELASNITRSLAAGEQLLALMRINPLVRDQANAICLERVKGNLAFRNVSFAYPPADSGNEFVLKDVAISLRPGELTVLAGASGSGKSTLLNLLLRLYAPTHGAITVDGVSISEIALQNWRSHITVMLQITHLFAGTIREAIAPENKTLPDHKLWEALAFVGLDDFVAGLPNGLDAQLGEDAMNLSGGQRKRISLARAFLLDRPILLLDEPLANIDAQSAGIILAALEKFRRDKTCLVITHRRELMLMADRLYMIEDGQVREADPNTLPTNDLAESPALKFDQTERMLL
ncbi:MAG: ABC transporter ATP-binding protein [bacterium]